MASLISLAVALVLIALKFWAWLATGSVAMLTSALDALVDAAAALATFIGVRFAQHPPDRYHRWGYGKAEAIAALMQALFLAGAALALIFQSIERLIRPTPLDGLGLGLWIIGISTIAAIGLVAMQSWVLRQTSSTAIAAHRTHYATDIAVNLAVLAALTITLLTGWDRADPVFAIGISCYMIWSAREVAADALRQLMDRELESKDRDRRITQAVLSSTAATAVHDLRTRDAGDRVFIEFHLEVDGAAFGEPWSRIADTAEKTAGALFPDGPRRRYISSRAVFVTSASMTGSTATILGDEQSSQRRNDEKPKGHPPVRRRQVER
jgi:cation diffusion facilitator family transporter